MKDSQESMVVQEPVQAAIWHCLNHYAYEDAIFLAERLFAEVGSDEALFLLATCYYRAGRPINTYWLLQSKGCRTPQCKFLLARCCLDLEKLSEGETCLAGNVFNKSKSNDDIISEFADSAGFVFSMLGDIFSHTERFSKGTEYYKKSLKCNPFLWSCYQSLCDLGEKPDPNKIFHVSSLPNFSTCQSFGYSAIPSVNQPTENVPMTTETTHFQDSTPITSSIMKESNSTSPDTGNESSTISTPDIVQSGLSSSNIASRGAGRTRPRVGRTLLGIPSIQFSPSFGVLPLDTPSPGDTGPNSYITPPTTGLNDMQMTTAPKKTLPRRNMSATTTKPVFTQSGNSSNRDIQITQTPSPHIGPPQQVLFQGVRRSSRLFSSSNSVKENAAKKAPTKIKFQSPKVPTRKTKTRSSKSTTISEQSDVKGEGMPLSECIKPLPLTPTVAQIVNFQKASAEGLMCLLRDIAKSYLSLSQYDCRKSITSFNNLPMHHYNTPWILCQVGRAYFEMAEYNQAEKYFGEVRRIAPYYLEGMEMYSTTLWHLQREVELSALAQELVEIDKEAPEAWCATGNCFSLQKEHDTAIKFFQRAIQCNPNFAYAYTLLGHEYVLTEELEKALACFRSAIRIDVRHYNAWYGVGMIYYKQEKFALAEMHYRKALSINSQSSALLCHIGVVQHALQKSDAALSTLNIALKSNPKNALCKFHKASILFATEKYQEALNELEELKEIVPKESLVYFLLGKVYKKLGQTHLALMNFSWAMDLDPKGTNNQIKEAIDKRYLPDDDDPTDTTLSEVNPDAAVIADVAAAVVGAVADADAAADAAGNDNEMEIEGDDVQLQSDDMLQANESDESL
ncbi:cell division cycle protein 27 homolog [Saccoglossus kowalevskii]|uniref:Cell division cycle protein 27 homolog n=1 Tax=Saccoglossus kowalevskii TaxID=10224 RepID=A0ABM0GY52_SACKO|nr:PREDICTED: cell division cycle protein 27 homolog [Saccoglossus kowalevskii]